jgi:hypothetical protein
MLHTIMSSWAVSIGTASVVVAEGIVAWYAEEVDVLVHKYLDYLPTCDDADVS